MVIASTADFASSTHNSASTRQGQQTSGQQDGTKVIGHLPRLHIAKQNLESMRTCSPLPPHQNVLQLLHPLVLSRTGIKYECRSILCQCLNGASAIAYLH